MAREPARRAREHDAASGPQWKATSSFSLKDQLFNADRVAYLTALLQRAHAPFPAASFQSAVIAAFPQLELKQRIAHIAAVLHESLPASYPEALAIILRALPPELDPDRTDDDFGDFIFAPLSHFVALYGCTAEYLPISLDALRQLTKRFSAEAAIRYFLNAFPDRTLAFLQACARDPHYHVRRLASEGTRPLLPWAQRLQLDYRAPLPLLDLLFADRTRYVTRSVANHLNDISKQDPDIVLATLQRWQRSGRQTPAELQFITQHALRTLVKRKHVGALARFGVAPDAAVTVSGLATSTPRVRIGDAFRFSLTLRSHERQKLLLEYLLTFAGDGRRASGRLFRLKQVELEAGQSITIAKAHPMRLMTTRPHFPGEHTVTVHVNGRAHGSLRFELTA